MKKYLIILAILCLPITSCKKDSPTEPVNGDENNGTSAVEIIGTSGGSIVKDDFNLTVPSNAFQSDNQITVTQDQSFCGEEAVSDAYMVEGIPEDFSGRLTVKLKSTRTAAEKAYVAVMMENRYTRTNGLTTVTDYIPAEVSDGYITAYYSGGSSVSGRSGMNKKNAGLMKLLFQGSDNGDLLSSSGHFKIVYPTVLKTQAQQLAGYLEESFNTAKSLEFSFQYSWPFRVNIKKFSTAEADLFGKYSHTLLGGEIEEINSDLISGSGDFKATAAHEFFHFVQDKYDMRSAAAKGSFAPQSLWLDEATAVWFEGKALNDESYVSAARLENELAPFEGMHSEPGTFSSNGADEHGYGISAMFNYMEKEHGKNIVSTMYNKLKAGSHPVEAVFISNPDPISFWWDDFLTKYALGKVTSDMTVNKLTKNSYIERWTIEHSSDTVFTFNSASKDLSGKLFDIKLNYELFDPDNELDINLTAPDFCKLNVFAYKDGYTSPEIKLLGSDKSSFTVTGIKDLKDQGYNLLALVTNSQIKSPYTNSTNIKLDLHLKLEEKERSAFDISKIKYIAVHAAVEGLFEDESGGGWLVHTTHRISNKNYSQTPLTLSGETVDFYVQASDSIHISARVDTSTGNVLGVHAAIKYFGGDRVVMDGENFPFYTFVDYNGKTIGYACAITSSCEGITYFDWQYSYYPTFKNLICEGGNSPSIFIYFLTERPGWL